MTIIHIFGSIIYAEDFVIIPKANDEASVQQATSELGKQENIQTGFFETYNKHADNLANKTYNSQTKARDAGGQGLCEKCGNQIASGIMNWDTIINLIACLINVFSQLALVIGAAMIIYAGYIYGTSVMVGANNATKGNDAIKNAIYGIIITIFAYAIMQILTSMFL